MRRLLLLLACGTTACAARTPVVTLEVQGHRGCRGLRPENTLSAFQHAIELGVDVLELDLALSRDDVLVVSHDPEVSRELCRETRALPSRRLRDLSWEEIRSLDCGSTRNRRFPEQVLVPGAHLPRLEEVLALLEQHPRLGANIEIKTFPDKRELTRPPADFARLLTVALRQRGLGGRVTVQSFDPEALRAVAGLDPSQPLAALVEDRGAIEPMLAAARVRILSPRFALLRGRDEVRAFQARGLRVVPWTVNEPADLQRVASWGVDGIITDYPDRLLRLLGRLRGGTR
jgi:glycerophosphoryl diester phosphodiesterase